MQFGRRRALFFGGAILAIAAIGSAGMTSAGFTDRTYAEATVATEPLPATLPVPGDQSAGSTLLLDRFGRLYVGGMRNSGDGNGSAATAPTAQPTQVNFPAGTVIRDAAGSSNDFSYASTTSYMALTETGQVWTWGRPYPDQTYLGRGTTLSLAQSYTAGQVTTIAGGGALPPIIDIERTENQFLALDADGTLWSWGYAGENLPRPGINPQLPAPSNSTSTNTGCSGAGTVTWHTIWGGNNLSGGVATNGLIYNWGFDSPAGVQNTAGVVQTCPRLMESANRALFQAYPDVYRTAAGLTYDEAVLTTEATRSARYNEIVAAMEPATLAACAGAYAKAAVDDTGCPVRQLTFSARAPRLLLENGDLYTWQITTDTTYGTRFLGRDKSNTSVANWAQDGSVYKPTIALSDVDYVVPGVSSVTALLTDGTVYGWGTNNFCQAIGARPSGTVPCSTTTNFNTDIVTLPVQIAIPGDVDIASLSGTQCATWAKAADGRVWAWGGGTISGNSFVFCTENTTPSRGYKIYDMTQASVANPFGAPITATSTGLLRVR